MHAHLYCRTHPCALTRVIGWQAHLSVSDCIEALRVADAACSSNGGDDTCSGSTTALYQVAADVERDLLRVARYEWALQRDANPQIEAPQSERHDSSFGAMISSGVRKVSVALTSSASMSQNTTGGGGAADPSQGALTSSCFPTSPPAINRHASTSS